MIRILQLQAAPSSAAAQGPAGLSYLVLWVPIIVIFYFLVFAPQRKRQKKVQQMLANLKTGDKVVTSGGIYGTIIRVSKEEDAIRLRIAPSVDIEVTRSSVSGMQPEPQSGS